MQPASVSKLSSHASRPQYQILWSGCLMRGLVLSPIRQVAHRVQITLRRVARRREELLLVTATAGWSSWQPNRGLYAHHDAWALTKLCKDSNQSIVTFPVATIWNNRRNAVVWSPSVSFRHMRQSNSEHTVSNYSDIIAGKVVMEVPLHFSLSENRLRYIDTLFLKYCMIRVCGGIVGYRLFLYVLCFTGTNVL